MAHILCVFLFPSWLIIGCAKPHATLQYETNSLLAAMKDGDLLFRRGTGFVGHVVTRADSEGLYSHVGIIITKDSSLYIVHAVPHEPDFDGDIDRVKCENVNSFIRKYPNANLGLYRLDISDSLKAIAAIHALQLSEQQIPFDHAYNLEDDTAFYCTELIEYVYAQVGISISEGRRTSIFLPGMRGEYIMPSDLTKCSKLKPVVCQ